VATLPALASAVNAIRSAQAGLDRTAARIARGGDPASLPADMVELSRAEHAVEANAAVVRTADEVAKATLDLVG
jgi:hypothetical protein